jgi:hypothetical protein
MLPTYVENARGGTEPLWTNPTFALTEDSSPAQQQLYLSTVNLSAWLWAIFPALPDLVSLSHVEIEHRVRYQNQTNPGTAVGVGGRPRCQWTWLWADGWGVTGGPIPIYTNQGQTSGAGTQTWPFAIDVWGVYGPTIVADAALTWAGNAFKIGRFCQALVYTFNTTYSSQRINFHVDVVRLKVRYMKKRSAFFRSIP